MGEYEMKLMDIDQEHLGIPDTQYDATIHDVVWRVPADLPRLVGARRVGQDRGQQGGRSVQLEGEVGTGSVLLKQSAGTDRGAGGSSRKVKREQDDDEEEERRRTASPMSTRMAVRPSAERWTALTRAEDEMDEDDAQKKRKSANGKAKVSPARSHSARAALTGGA